MLASDRGEGLWKQQLQTVHPHAFYLVEETERRLPHVRSLRLIKEDRYGGWLKFIAL